MPIYPSSIFLIYHPSYLSITTYYILSINLFVLGIYLSYLSILPIYHLPIIFIYHPRIYAILLIIFVYHLSVFHHLSNLSSIISIYPPIIYILFLLRDHSLKPFEIREGLPKALQELALAYHFIFILCQFFLCSLCSSYVSILYLPSTSHTRFHLRAFAFVALLHKQSYPSPILPSIQLLLGWL